jgi:hypothetical protein
MMTSSFSDSRVFHPSSRERVGGGRWFFFPSKVCACLTPPRDHRCTVELGRQVSQPGW